MESSPLVTAAERTARRVLRDERQRLSHVEGTARAAAHVASTLDPGIAASVVAAAWLHDIGVENHLTVLDPVAGPAADVLTFADLVAGVDGSGTTIRARIDGMRARHASSPSPVPLEVREDRYRRLAETGTRVLRSSRLTRVSLVSA